MPSLNDSVVNDTRLEKVDFDVLCLILQVLIRTIKKATEYGSKTDKSSSEWNMFGSKL